ncbi:MAG: enoyl-CoA hydratase-related protein [Bacillales bacterium]
MPSFVSYESFENGIALVTLNRPEAANALSIALLNELSKLLDDLAFDKAVRVVMITGAGDKAFCAGADLKERKNLTDDEVRRNVNKTRTLFQRISELPKPTIAAVNGYAFGGGFELMLACDLRIAAKDSVVAYPEAKLGIMGGIGPGMIRYMPAAIALEMLYTGERMPADRLYHAGFLNRVVAKGAALTAATEMARGIAKNAPLVLTAIKRLTSAYPIHNPIEIGAVVSQILRPIRESEDAKEGITAFKEKREPHFTGR